MTWKTKGKIGCHFPERSGLNPNFDVTRIVYSQDGVVANAKEIEKVYYISPAAAEAIVAKSTHEERMAELAKWLVWQRYWAAQRTLIAGDKLVAIQYIPTSDIYVQTIEIFTTSNQGNNDKARVKILHESGLYIAAFNADNGPDSATEYQLAGYKRYVNNQNVLLKGGKTYYIVYQHDDESPGEDTFWPAYFNGENGVFKEYNNNRDTVTTTDITSFGTYIGETNDLAIVFDASENDFFIWTGDTAQLDSALFVRSNKGNGTDYKGELGVNSGSIRAEDIAAFCAMSENDSFRFMPQNGPLSSGNYAYKSSPTPSNVTDYASKDTAVLRLANLLKDIKSYTTALCVSGPSSWEYGWNGSDVIGHIFKMQSGYTSQISSLTPIDTLPTNPINGGFYFIKGGTISGDNDDNVYYYDGSWQKVYNYTTLSSMIDNSGTYGDYMTEIGNNSALVKQKISGEGVISNTLRSATTGNRKYYLKINGNEV